MKMQRDLDTIRNFGDGGFVWYFYMRDEYGYYGYYSQDWVTEHCKRFGW